MLTQRKVRELVVPGRYRDGLMPGLYLAVSESGAKSWVLRYVLAGRERMMGLGSAKVFTLKEARERARAARQQLVDKVDPLVAKRAAAAAAELDAGKHLTFSDAADKFVAQHEAKWSRSHRDAVVNTLATYAHPVIGNLSVADIDVAAVLRVIEPLWQTKTETADRVRGRIEQVLGWATVRGHRTGANPAKWKDFLDQVLPAKADIAPTVHHAAMPYADIGAFMGELRGAEGIAYRALEFCILTAARTSEALGARWSEIDLDAAVWTVPPERMKKSKKEHRVPLSAAALTLLQSMPREDGNDHVFIGRRPGTSMSDMSLNRALRSLRSEFVVHGFRSGFSDWAHERTGFSNHVIELSLAHSVGNAVEQAYRRGDLFDKCRQLMAAWARFCGAPAVAGTVTPLRGAVS